MFHSAIVCKYWNGAKKRRIRSIRFEKDSPTYLKYLTPIRFTCIVHTRLVHPQRNTVEQDHHHRHPLEPCTMEVKEKSLFDICTYIHT